MRGNRPDMDVPSYVKAAPARRFGLRERLLLGLLLGALATVMVALVGWISFQRVVASQQAIVRDTLPAADALHEAVRGNARLAALAPRLARADSKAELEQLRAMLGADLPLIRDRLGALDSPHVEPDLRDRLRATGEALAARLDAMADTLAERLRLRDELAALGRTLRAQVEALEALAGTQADNATALLVSTLTSLMQPPPAGGGLEPAARAAARDRLLDLDLDTLERMHELSLTVHALGALVDRLDEFDTGARLAGARTEFAARLALLARRLRDIADPVVRAQGMALHDGLATALAPAGAFAVRGQALELRAQADALQTEVGTLTTELDALAGELIHRGGRILASASLAAERSATSGLMAFGAIGAALLLVTALVTGRVLRRHTLGRLLALEQATLALAAGRRDVRIDTAGDDELASLSRALERFRNDAIERDRLAEALRQQQQALEHEVAARTAELRQSNAALAREMAEHADARVAAEKADRAKTAFLGTVSHELRTPMAGILGLLELLEDTEPAPGQQQYLAQIRAAALLLLELLEDMLDFARIEAGGVHVENTPFSLRDTVNDVFAVQGARAAARGLALVADIAPAMPDLVLGDRRKLSQILLNLVGNAIKFSDEGAVTVRIAPGRAPGALAFAVEDHGIGIDPERQREVFEPFVQVRDSGRHHAGTGLGLAVCKRLVQAMGGEIALRSAPGRGTTVSFELNLAPAASAPAAAPGAPIEVLDRAHAVLLVEDDAVNRMVVERFLQRLGQHPVCATDIQSALGALSTRWPALALVDMNLPDGDGRELLARVRALPGGRALPMVLMSAHLPASEVQALLDAGFSAFLSKPFTRLQLQALLARLLAPAGGGDVLPATGVAQLPAAPETAEPPATEAGEAPLEWVSLAFLRAEREALGAPVVAEIARVFRVQGDELVAALLAAAQAGQAEDCARLAHKLRGAAFNLGLERLGRAAGQLEEDLRAAAAGASLPARAEALRRDYLRSVESLASALDGLGAAEA